MSPAKRAIEAQARRLFACGIGRSGGDDRRRVELHLGSAERGDSRRMDPRQAGPGEHALGCHPTMHALEERPQRALLLADRAEVDMAGLGGKRRMTTGRVDQRADAEAGAGAKNHLWSARFEWDRADLPRPALGNGRQRQRLGLEIVEQQALGQAKPARRLGAVDHPRRIGQLEPAPVDRSGAADDERARALAVRGDRRLGGFGQAGVVVGLEVDRLADRDVGRRLQGEARVGAADVDDENGEWYDEIAHGGP
jgi:hypothetical protein